MTTNGNCDTEPPGLEIYCERKADHYAVEVKIRGLDNERDYFSAYWNAWYSTVKTPATRVAVFEGGVSMPVINRLMWQEERDSKTEVKLIEKRENKIVVGCGLPNLQLADVKPFEREENYKMDYYMRNMVDLYRDGKEIIRDDIYGRYRRSEGVTAALRQCQSFVNTPILEPVSSRCNEAFVLNQNPTYNRIIETLADRLE